MISDVSAHEVVAAALSAQRCTAVMTACAVKPIASLNVSRPAMVKFAWTAEAGEALFSSPRVTKHPVVPATLSPVTLKAYLQEPLKWWFWALGNVI